MSDNRKDSYKAFLRSAPKVMSKTDHYQASLPPHIRSRMKWKVNEKIRILTDRKNNIVIIKQGDEDVDV
tara:strand:- start:599 stop:805 length:207 start_codon:yes stop_codon:yes gene_type:complete